MFLNWDQGAAAFANPLLTSCRVLSALINSLFAFYWDVAKDWDLTLFSALNHPNDPEYPFGLRRHRYFYANEMYYSAIIIDLILRFTWISRLSTRLDWVNDLEGGVFVLMLLEVVRRWIWIFFRVETEWGEYHDIPALNLFNIYYIYMCVCVN